MKQEAFKAFTCGVFASVYACTGLQKKGDFRDPPMHERDAWLYIKAGVLTIQT